ncbi:MAG: helix-turn-helix domain-containing protein, partial [bacterium]
MVVQPELSQHLVNLGLNKPEADAYIQLLSLGSEGPVSGYQVAKELKKDPTSVYKALRELVRIGGVVTTSGKGTLYAAVPPEDFIRILARRFNRLRAQANRALEGLRPEAPDQHLFTLRNRDQLLQRFRDSLDECRHVALLDLAPRLLSQFQHDIGRAVERGVTVVIRLYKPAEIPGATVVVEPEGSLLVELMPGPKLTGVFDCRNQVSAFLDRDPLAEAVPQAVWSASPFLAYQAHSGLAAEIIHTELRRGLLEGASPQELQTRQDRLAALIHSRVDWEALWGEMGIGEIRRSPAIREETQESLPRMMDVPLA